MVVAVALVDFGFLAATLVLLNATLQIVNTYWHSETAVNHVNASLKSATAIILAQSFVKMSAVLAARLLAQLH